MECVEGEPLYEWAQRNKITSGQSMRMVAQIGRALAATHAMGGVHRDMKGGNVLVAPGGRAVLTGFGSSTYRGARPLTRQPEFPGTAPYWSPEALRYQWRIRRRSTASYEASPADDVYALGVMAYRLVTGTYPPGWAPDGDGVTRAEQVAPEALVTVSPELAALIRRMLSKDAVARGSAEDVAEALEQAARKAGRRADQPIARKKTWEARVDALRSGLRRPEVAWAGWLAATALGGALAIKSGSAQHEVKPAEPPAAVASAERVEGKDGGAAALGNEALTERVEVERSDVRQAGFSLEMSKDPLPGQRRPPCKKNQVVIYGGCWILMSKGTPPCEDDLYAWKDACYAPAIVPGRPSTSKDP
jgi:hypothetical protein